tara:strand:- start:209 stop:451 length:243 start_codon:yes stop_codon:yes gene_type:complete
MDLTKKLPKGSELVSVTYRDNYSDDTKTTVCIRVGYKHEPSDRFHYLVENWIKFDVPKIEGNYDPKTKTRKLEHPIYEGE